MRQDSYPFNVQNASATKEPRFVIKIEFETDSIYMTSHDDIQGVPGTVLYGVLQAPSAVSQKIVPDEGRSEIGAMSFSLIDYNSQFTEEIASRLQNAQGMRRRKVKLWIGYRQTNIESGYGSGEYGSGEYGVGGSRPGDPVFSDFQLFQTQIVKDCGFDAGVYNVRCLDITREQRVNVFDVKTTTLRDSITATDTTIPVYSTLGFQPVYHGTSYSDAPSSVVGYIKIGSEVIRYTGITDDSFTGCTRGVLNTKSVAVTVSSSTEQDNRPKVEEYVYLEMPAVKLAYAIMTGVIHGTEYTLPSHWHMGIDEDLINADDYTDIGLDLWDTTDDTAGFVVRFVGLKKTDGKKFIESELLMLLACYQPVYSDGSLGLKRMTQVLADAAYVALLNEDNVVSVSELTHEMDGMYNQLAINWNYNGSDYTRRNVFIDAESVAIHGSVPLKTLNFKGLSGSRHTSEILKQRIHAFRDRYTQPPETITVQVLPSLSRLEVGDIVRLQLDNVRDFAGETVAINRSFEIQQKSENFASGDVTLTLFGSTAAANDASEYDSGGSAALPDAFYTSAGTELSTVVDITVVGGVGVVDAGTWSLTGNSDLNAAGAIYYYDGDLTIPDGATIKISDNVQLRVKGFLTLDGDIDGVGAGLSGTVDDGVIDTYIAGVPGYFGATRGMDGIYVDNQSPRLPAKYGSTYCSTTIGKNSVAPLLTLNISGDELTGLPSDVRGTSGGPGGKITSDLIYSPYRVEANGGDGGNGGAGLIIISRGCSMGASSLIDLSGGDTPVSIVEVTGRDMYPGAGGVGCPGCLYILIDGNDNFFPDISGHFLGKTGTSGNPLENTKPKEGLEWASSSWSEPLEGYLDPGFISNVDYSSVAYRIQYLPQEETAQEDSISVGSFSAVQVSNGVKLSWEYGIDSIYTPYFEIYASLTNDRTDSALIATTTGHEFIHVIASSSSRTYYYWIRARLNGTVSDWLPESSTNGLTESIGTIDTSDIADNAATAIYTSVDSTQTTTAISQSFMTIAVPAQSVGHKALVSVVADVWKTTSGDYAECYIARLSGGTPVGTVSQPMEIVDLATPGKRVSLYFEYDAAASTEYSYSFWYAGTSLGNYGEARNISMKIELIKR